MDPKIKLLLLIFALPAQYYLGQYWSNDYHEQNEAFQEIVTSFTKFKSNYLNSEAWMKWYIDFVIEHPVKFHKKSSKVMGNKKGSQNEENYQKKYDIAIEVFNLRKSFVNYAESSRTRSPRPSKVQFRVGDVIRHKKINAYGVIIGWDETAMVSHPKEWFKNVNEAEMSVIMNEPHYAVLLDEKSQTIKNQFKGYFYQDDIELVPNGVRVVNHLISSYFDKYKDGRYVSGKFLHAVYPNDD